MSSSKLICFPLVIGGGSSGDDFVVESLEGEKAERVFAAFSPTSGGRELAPRPGDCFIQLLIINKNIHF